MVRGAVPSRVLEFYPMLRGSGLDFVNQQKSKCDSIGMWRFFERSMFFM